MKMTTTHLCGVLQILHVRGYEECAQLDEITMLSILHIDNAPGILTSSHLLASDLEDCIAADNSERYRCLQLAILLLEIVILVRVAFGKLIQLNVIVLEILQYALLQLAHLRLVQAIRLANHQHNVHLTV